MIRIATLKPCFFALAALALITLPFLGCGSGEPSGTVSGKVTYKGEPVSEAIVTFKHVENGASAQGELDSSGQYEIVGADGGLPIGSYTVMITVPQVEDPKSPKGQSPMFMDKVMPNVPKQYRSASSPLKADLVEGANTHDFELKDK